MKRIISCVASDFNDIKVNELKNAILQSEGRVVMSETAVNNEALVGGISNCEVLAMAGTDLITLKGFDVENPKINGIDVQGDGTVRRAKELSGRIIGISLEIVPNGFKYENGLKLSVESIQLAMKQQPDYICLTAYRNPGNTSEVMKQAIALVRSYYDGLLVINKYGNSKEILEDSSYQEYVVSGADIITLPMPGTVAGIQVSNITTIIDEIKAVGGLVSMVVATSQEGSDENTIRQLALNAKQSGADVYGFGDAHQNGMACVENITTLSIAVRGKRHTYFRMASSINR